MWTVRGWAYSGRIASIKLGARLMIPTTELDRLIKENLRPAIGRTGVGRRLRVRLPRVACLSGAPSEGRAEPDRSGSHITQECPG